MHKQQTFKGKPVYDATEPQEVDVKPAHIERGVRGDPGGCAFSQGAMDVFCGAPVYTHVSRVFVGAVVFGEECFIKYKAPNRLGLEEKIYDRGGKFWPGKYVLEPPPAVKKRKPGQPWGSGQHTGTQPIQQHRARVGKDGDLSIVVTEELQVPPTREEQLAELKAFQEKQAAREKARAERAQAIKDGLSPLPPPKPHITDGNFNPGKTPGTRPWAR